MSKQTFNQYANYPTVAGIIIVRDVHYKHLFSMYTDNIRARVQSVNEDHKRGSIKKYPSGWSQGRVDVANSAVRLVFDYVEMPNTSRDTLRTIVDAMDSESLSKNIA